MVCRPHDRPLWTLKCPWFPTPRRLLPLLIVRTAALLGIIQRRDVRRLPLTACTSGGCGSPFANRVAGPTDCDREPGSKVGNPGVRNAPFHGVPALKLWRRQPGLGQLLGVLCGWCASGRRPSSTCSRSYMRQFPKPGHHGPPSCRYAMASTLSASSFRSARVLESSSASLSRYSRCSSGAASGAWRTPAVTLCFNVQQG